MTAQYSYNYFSLYKNQMFRNQYILELVNGTKTFNFFKKERRNYRNTQQVVYYLFVKLCFLCAFGEKNVAITESNFHCCKAESIGVLF